MNDAKEDTVKKYWEDPSVFQVNRLPARAHFFPFESKPLARGNDRSKSNYFRSLNGTWKFHFSPNPRAKPKEFFQTDFNVNHWDDITVPGHWEMQGYSVPIYLDEEYPFKPDPPKVPFDYNSVGSYQRSFTIPDDWQGDVPGSLSGGDEYLWLSYYAEPFKDLNGDGVWSPPLEIKTEFIASSHFGSMDSLFFWLRKFR